MCFLWTAALALAHKLSRLLWAHSEIHSLAIEKGMLHSSAACKTYNLEGNCEYAEGQGLLKTNVVK